MKRVGAQDVSHPVWGGIACFIALLVFTLTFGGCSSKPKQAARRYHLKGKVVSINQDSGSVVVDAEAIPGFMDAMAMPYPVGERAELGKLGPGDEITADVVVTDDGAHLENIVITKKGAGSKTPPAGHLHQPQPGERVPDFAFTNQDGKRIHFSSLRGSVVLVTFIYTRCPFSDYCPRVSKNFANIYAALRADRSLYSKTHLLSLSFDPAYDSPDVLRRYAASFAPSIRTSAFDRWELASVRPIELDRIVNFFGVYRDSTEQPLTHSQSTSVISPEGTIYKWYADNDWKPEDLIRDATRILEQEKGAHAARAGLGARGLGPSS
jgi:protein SCO1/2